MTAVYASSILVGLPMRGIRYLSVSPILNGMKRERGCVKMMSSPYNMPP